MTFYRQTISDPGIGDCFRACMGSLLDLPPQVLPNDFSPNWHGNWQTYLKQFGLALSPAGRPDGPIWMSSPWIATVPSLNYDDCLHAILVHQANVVLHDPSNKKRYKTGSRLPFAGTVQAGQHLVVTDSSRLSLLVGYQEQVRGWMNPTPEEKS